MKTVIEMAREAGHYNPESVVNFLEAFAKLVKKDAYEEAARVCDDWIRDGSFVAEDIASAIRAWGEA